MKFEKLMGFRKPVCSVITAQGLIENWSSGGEKIILCIVGFAYSLLSLLAVV